MPNHTTAVGSPVHASLEGAEPGNEPTRRRPTRRWRNAIAASVAALALAVTVAGAAAPASAASSIVLPGGFTCNSATAKLEIPPPRVTASRGTEQFAWVNGIERFNPATNSWYVYKTYTSYSSYNTFGQSMTSWGGNFANSTLNLPVYHQGYYRIGTAVAGNQGGTAAGYIGNGAWCYIS